MSCAFSATDPARQGTRGGGEEAGGAESSRGRQKEGRRRECVDTIGRRVGSKGSEGIPCEEVVLLGRGLVQGFRWRT